MVERAEWRSRLENERFLFRKQNHKGVHMASNTIALNDHAAVSNSFSLQGNTQTEAKYIDPDSTLAAPLGFSVKHSVPPIGSKANNRHTVTFFDVDILSDGGTAVGSVKVEISVPRSSTWTEVQTRALVGYAVSYLTDARVQTLIDGITP